MVTGLAASTRWPRRSACGGGRRRRQTRQQEPSEEDGGDHGARSTESLGRTATGSTARLTAEAGKVLGCERHHGGEVETEQKQARQSWRGPGGGWKRATRAASVEPASETREERGWRRE